MPKLSCLAAFLTAAILIGCGERVQKHEVTIKIETDHKLEEQLAAAREDIETGDEWMDKLNDQISPTATDEESELAITRLSKIQHKFTSRMNTKEIREAAKWRRKLLEGKTIADLAREQREKPIH